MILGRDLAGVIEEVGPELSRYRAGDEVFGFHSTPVLHDGTWADYVASPGDTFIASKPTSVDFLEAGALPLAGVAPLMSVDAIVPSVRVSACSSVAPLAAWAATRCSSRPSAARG